MVVALRKLVLVVAAVLVPLACTANQDPGRDLVPTQDPVDVAPDPATQALKAGRWESVTPSPKPPPVAPPLASKKAGVTTVEGTCTDANARIYKQGEAGYDTCVSGVYAKKEEGKADKRSGLAPSVGASPQAGPGANYQYNIGK